MTSAGSGDGPVAAAGVRPLVTLLPAGAAPVCEGDVCLVPGIPGAEGAWTEVPD
jgi:hypothetical protein